MPEMSNETQSNELYPITQSNEVNPASGFASQRPEAYRSLDTALFVSEKREIAAKPSFPKLDPEKLQEIRRQCSHLIPA